MTEELIRLLGSHVESTLVKDFITCHPSFKWQRPESGAQYAISNDLGIDVLFMPDDGYQGGNTRHLSRCQSIFLYADGVEGHAQFGGTIPLNFSFDCTRAALVEKMPPLRTWKIGQGEVPADFPDPSHDKWELERCTISAHYKKASGAIKYFVLGRSNA